MSEVLLTRQTIDASQVHGQVGVDSESLFSHLSSSSSVVKAFTPYLTNPDPSLYDRMILDRLAPASRDLTLLCANLGSDNVLALAEWRERFAEYNVGLMGASTTLYASRIGDFGKALETYQYSLLDYRKQARSGSPLAVPAKHRAHAAFDKLQTQFRHELRAITANIKSRRGTPLTSSERATNIARSSRSASKLNVTTQAQAHQLVKFTSYAKVLGNGLVVIDFGSRVGNVHNSYQAGGNWERELFIESSSFALSTIAGTAAVKGGLALLAVATPVGWFGLIVSGIAIAGLAAGASLGMNTAAKNLSGDLYDDVTVWISSLWT